MSAAWRLALADLEAAIVRFAPDHVVAAALERFLAIDAAT